MTKYDVGVADLDAMEMALQEHLMNIAENSVRCKPGRKIGQVTHQFDEGGTEEKEDWQQHWDAEDRKYWIRTAMKRTRTEEHETERNRMEEEVTREVRKAISEEGKVGGKGKGPKGKRTAKGPKGGCHECGCFVFQTCLTCCACDQI